jgi:hypothetical protein
VDQGYGVVCDLDGRPIPELIVTEANQEHGIVARRDGGAPPELGVGTRLRILPNPLPARPARSTSATTWSTAGRDVAAAGSASAAGSRSFSRPFSPLRAARPRIPRRRACPRCAPERIR